jgi:hypothetical protein
MNIFSRITALAALPLLWTCSPVGDQRAAAASTNGQPVVVELFQSQGCSSCPPAVAALNALAGRKDVIALSFAVTYWDRLGWKDIFGDPAYTQRQHDYATSLHNNSVYTPQVVLNGASAMVGNGPGELDRAVAASQSVSGSPSINLESGAVSLGKGEGSATIWMIEYDPATHVVNIGAGENSGRKLPHRNIVRKLAKLGSWSGKPARYALPAKSNVKYKTVVLVQRGHVGRIIAAAQF